MKIAGFLFALLFAPFAGAFCYEEAGAKYSVDPLLLRAIALTESKENPVAKNINTNGSSDIGVMQINSVWLPKLKAFGIDRLDLLDACQSVHVGAWVVAQNMQRYGRTWRAVGAYNAGSESKRKIYVDKVWKQYQALIGAGGRK